MEQASLKQARATALHRKHVCMAHEDLLTHEPTGDLGGGVRCGGGGEGFLAAASSTRSTLARSMTSVAAPCGALGACLVLREEVCAGGIPGPSRVEQPLHKFRGKR